jgi:sigma-B regulation protein RsbU (phosphoserine phosphatase)
LVVGDVSGKGVPAALISTTVAHLLPSLQPLNDPALAFHELNKDLTERLPSSAFVSLVLAEVDTRSGGLRTWNAGHPPALLWRGGQERVVQTDIHNLLLGILPDYHCRPEEWLLEIGDVLLLYSDGLIEAPNAQGERYEIERAAEVLRQNAHRSAEEIADAFVSAIRQWGNLSDDLTLLVCKRVSETDPRVGGLEEPHDRSTLGGAVLPKQNLRPDLL